MIEAQPLWKTVLCWGTVAIFLSLPLLTFLLHILSIEQAGLQHLDEHIKEFSYIGRFYQTVTAVTLSLAGIDLADRFVASRHQNHKTISPKP